MRALLFDLDDTLYDRSAPFRKAYEELYQGKYPAAARDVYLAVTRRGDEVFEASQRGEMPLRESHIYRVKHGFADMGIPMTDEEALHFQQTYEAKQGEIELPKAMKEMLECCKNAGIFMGILTNGPGEHQTKKIRKLGLQQWIDEEHVVISGNCGMVKPEKRIFDYTRETMGLGDAEIWYVGDSYEKDILGAAVAGWKTIWINREKKELTKGMVQPDQMVYDEEELLTYIRCEFLTKKEQLHGRKGEEFLFFCRDEW